MPIFEIILIICLVILSIIMPYFAIYYESKYSILLPYIFILWIIIIILLTILYGHFPNGNEAPYNPSLFVSPAYVY